MSHNKDIETWDELYELRGDMPTLDEIVVFAYVIQHCQPTYGKLLLVIKRLDIILRGRNWNRLGFFFPCHVERRTRKVWSREEHGDTGRGK